MIEVHANNHTIRIEVENARIQANLKYDILEHKVELQKGIAGKKRGQQKTRNREADDIRLTSIGNEYVDFKREMYLKLARKLVAGSFGGHVSPCISGLVQLLIQRSGEILWPIRLLHLLPTWIRSRKG